MRSLGVENNWTLGSSNRASTLHTPKQSVFCGYFLTARGVGRPNYRDYVMGSSLSAAGKLNGRTDKQH